MAETIKGKFFSSIFWSFSENVLVRGASFVFSIFLARLLTPEDYGLIGMLTVFITISQVFINSGISDALIQKKDCNDIDYSTGVLFNISVSIFVYLILFILAPFIANFYHEKKLCLLLRVIALNPVIGSLSLVQRAKLTKELNFRPISIISLCCSLISGLIGVLLAFWGYGVWALASMTLISTLLSVILYPCFSKWLPVFIFSLKSFKHLWNYGSKLIVTGLANAVILNLSSLLIGRFYRSAQVGYYTRAQSLGDLPSTILFSVFSSVTFPVLCNYQDDRPKLMQAYRRIIFNIVLITCPIILCLVLLAKPLVVVLLTEKWLPSVPLLQLLLLARMFLPITSTHTFLLRSTGRTDLDMKLYIITGPLYVLSILVAIPFGVRAMAFAVFIAAALSYFINSLVIGKLYGYTVINQMLDWKMIFVSLIIMITGVFFVKSVIESPIIQLLVGGLVGIVLYAACCFLFNLIDKDIVKLLSSKIRKV